MNILKEFPVSVYIAGEEYKINSDFRAGLKFELLMQDVNIDDEEKLIKALELYYEKCPSYKNMDEAIEKMLWFYLCGNEIKNTSNHNSRGEEIYSFEHDCDYIYAAFMSQYKIDLYSIDYLHWWKYKALFKGLTEDNEIVKIMGYRSMDLSKIKDKEQKEHYKKLKKMYALPVKVSETEKEKFKEINSILSSGGDVSKVL